MEYLCYQNWWRNETTAGSESPRDCSIQFISIVGNVFFTYLVVLILIYRKCCTQCAKGRGPSTAQTLQNRFRGKLFLHHVFIWILTLVLFVSLFMDFSEALILFLDVQGRVVTEAGSSEAVLNYFRFFSPLTGMLILALLALFYHHVESNRATTYLWLNIAYFLLSSIFSIVRLRIHLRLELELLHVKIISDIVTGITSAVLLILLLHTYFHHRKELQGTEDISLKYVKYLHYYSPLLSRLSFYWFTAILWLGYKQPLEEEDLGYLPAEERTKFQCQRLQTKYDAEKIKSEPHTTKPFSLWNCLFKTIWSSMVIGAMFRLAADMTGFVAPLGIRTIVAYVKGVSRNSSLSDAESDMEILYVEHLTISELMSNGYVMAVVILLASVLQSTFSQCSTFLVNSEGIHLKIALQALIYKKSLTLSPTKSSGSLIQQSELHPSLQQLTKEEDDDLAASGSVQGSTAAGSSGFDNGSIVNIMSEDTNNIMMFFWMAHFIWAIPLKLAILMGLLYLQLGYSALIGAAICILIMIPLQFYIGRKMSTNSKDLMERCDERLRSISEILQGMKLLKLHGWELIFSENLLSIRNKELKHLDRDLLYRSIMTFLTHISSVLVTVVTFGLHPYIETEKLDPPKVFAGLALFNQLTVPLFIFPITVPVVIDALVSARRVREFLLLPEAAVLTKSEHSDKGSKTNSSLDRDDSVKSKKPDSLALPYTKTLDLEASTDSVFTISPIPEGEEDEDEEDDDADEETPSTAPLLNAVPGKDTIDAKSTKPVELNASPPDKVAESIVTVANGDFSWEEDRHDHTLNGVTTRIPKGKLTVIVGSIGSGKSSLISALLGEMKVIRGEVQWSDDARLAYAAQKPWIQNCSVRENIIFGKKFKQRRYQKVINACGLQPDIDILPLKDSTEIGEKGINLSGGQRQRIAIARSLYYSNANVVIMDDPLSALDVEVADGVFNTGIKKFLLKAGKTVILVTHHLPALPDADHIIAMDKGNIRIQGTWDDIRSKDPTLYADWMEIMNKKKEEIDKKTQQKTGKERWKLVQIVSKIGLQRHRTNEVKWKQEDEVKPPHMELYRRRQLTFSAYRNLSNDIFLPSDDCHCTDDMMMTPLLRRRAISRQSRLSRDSRTSASSNPKLQPQPGQPPQPNKHSKVARLISLQFEPTTTPSSKGRMNQAKLKRMQSLPVEDEVVSCVPPPDVIRGRADTLDSSSTQRPMFRRLLSAAIPRKTLSSTGSSATELDQIPPPAKFQREQSARTISGLSESDTPEDEDEVESLLTREHSHDEREYGKIPTKVYLSYISACGTYLSLFYLFFSIGYEVVRVYTNFWLKQWSDQVSTCAEEDYDDVMSHHFLIYVILSVVTVLVSLTSNLVGKQAGANSRETLHNRMLNRVIRCPMRFFDGTPIGRVINRFSSDVAVVDRKLCISMQRFLQFVFLCVSAIVVNAIVNPWFLIVAIPVVGIYYFIQRFYRFSSRELQRIEAISRGPIYSHFHETLEGLSTIRAFREERRFTKQMMTIIDMNNRAAIFINVGNRWLSISLDYLGSVIVFLATLVSMISSHLYPETVTPSMVGLAINYTLLVPVYLNWVVKFLAEVEMFMNSVERIDRYSALEIEDYGEGSEEPLPKVWPSTGQVTFENVSVRYGPDRPEIIKDLNADVKPTQKVGICGRSGSGKSSLLMALFRISDVCQGKILIDGVDIYKIPLIKLRSSLSIIPQENILFSGTVRFNLDPLRKVSDAEIWKALELSQMKDTIKEMPGQLDADVKDGGSTFSAGQKQLLGLARAILHNSKVVIMDEATSSVDLATERILLQVVKDVFKDSTVLTIAHRLDTIVDGDRILVLDAGRLVEEGHPDILLRGSGPSSIFKSMMKHTDEQGHLR